MITFEDRALGCFKGLATGDAIGKQTEMLSRADVQKWYPEGITGLSGGPLPLYKKMAGIRPAISIRRIDAPLWGASMQFRVTTR